MHLVLAPISSSVTSNSSCSLNDKGQCLNKDAGNDDERDNKYDK